MNVCDIYNIPCRHWIGGCYDCTACPGKHLHNLPLKGTRSPDHLTGLGTVASTKPDPEEGDWMRALTTQLLSMQEVSRR